MLTLIHGRGLTSTLILLLCEVLQGSVLRLLLFVAVYCRHQWNIEECGGAYVFICMLYTSWSSAADFMLCCIDDVDRWISSNRLKLLTDKTHFIWIGWASNALECQRSTTIGRQCWRHNGLWSSFGIRPWSFTLHLIHHSPQYCHI